MMLTSFLAAVALQGEATFTSVKFVGACESQLSQSFYDLEDGSLAERYIFAIKQSVKPRPNGYDWQFERTLTAHRLDDLDLDVPKEQKPTLLKSIWNERGMDISERPFMEDWLEFRIERLRWFFWPANPLHVGQSWSGEPPVAQDHDVPRIRLTFRLERIEGSKASVSVSAQELDVNDGLKSEGQLVVDLKRGWVERGDWTSPRVPMPGGVQSRYRLVQQVRPKGGGI